MSIRVSDLDKYGPDRDRFLFFLNDLEKRGLLKSSLEKMIGKRSMERVWTCNELEM